MKNHRKILSILLLFFVVVAGFAQENLRESLSTEATGGSRSKYIKLSFGMSNSVFRDFATSPLFYRGIVRSQQLAFEANSDKMEREYGLNFLSGNYNAVFNENKATSQTQTMTFYYSQLFQLKRRSSKRRNFKVGALFFATGNLRGNLALQNNGRGLESFHSLMGSAKMSFDLSRTKSKEKKFLFIKCHLKPRKRVLSFRLNVGLINFSGFMYRDSFSIFSSQLSTFILASFAY